MNDKAPIGNDKGIYEFEITSDQEVTPLKLVLINLRGETESEIDLLTFTPEASRRVISRITPSLGFAYLNYSQKPNVSYSTISPALAISGNALKNDLLSARAELDGVSGISNYSDLELSLWANTHLLPLLSDFGLKLSGGLAYHTSFTSASTFGFQNLYGPTAAFTLIKNLPNDSRLEIQVGLDIIFDGATPVSLSSNEIYTRAHYFFRSPWGIELEGKFLSLQTQGDVADVSAQIMVLGATYSF